MIDYFDEDTIQDYLNMFDSIVNLIPKENQSSVWGFDISENALCEQQQTLANLILGNPEKDSDCLNMGCLIFYGYRLGTINLNGKNECFTRQGGYRDKAILKYDTDDLLEYEVDESDDESSVSRLIGWIINPESNLEIADSVIRKMVVPMINNLSKVTPPGKQGNCKVLLPPVSEDIDINDWGTLFEGVTADELCITISNYGELIDITADERQYFYIHQTDGQSEYIIISAYENIRGHNSCIGSIAFDVSDNNMFYRLHDFKETVVKINSRSMLYEKKERQEIVNDWNYVEENYPVSKGIISFLGSHAVSFYREMYKIQDYNRSPDTSAGKLIRAVFKPNESLQADEICSRLLKQNNLYNIALGDVVYISYILQKDSFFTPVLIGTNKHYKLGTLSVSALKSDMNRYKNIPANFSTITWRLANKSRKVKSYFQLDAKKHTLNDIIESIIEHFEHCTTDIVAEELLYIYKNGEDSSALFAVKVFMYLSQLKGIEIESRNEIISSFENVDNISYKEIDKSNIKYTVANHKSYNNKKAQKYDPADISIDEMELSVRTYNCLKRARIHNTKDLTKKTYFELLKIRNLGERGVIEVVNKLKSRGLNIKQ